MAQKKILFVDEHKIVNYAGGVERVICAFANEFVGRGFAASIVGMDMERGVPFFPLDEAVRFVNLADSGGREKFRGVRWLLRKTAKELLRTFGGAKMQFRGKKLKDPKQGYYFRVFAELLRECVNAERPDIIITVTADSALLAQKISRDVPIIAMCHTDPNRFIGDYTSEQLEAWRKCQAVQVLMPSFAPPLKNIGVKRVEVIPNAVAQTAEHDRRDLSAVKNRVIAVGRIDGSVKRQHLLLGAFALVAEDFPEWSLVFYGNVANRRYKQRLDKLIAEHNLKSRVEFAGVSHDLPRVFSEADIFVFPSAYEGFGLALAEAMSAGLAVVGCRDCPAVSELITDQDDGLLAEGTEDGIANSLRRLMSDENLRMRLGRKAHETAKVYAPSKVWDEWAKLIADFV